MFESSPIFALLARALDAAALRQSVHTTNIANAEVPDFHRLEVQFDAASAASPGLSGGLDDASWSMPDARVVSTNDTVRLDQEMALMAKDALRYQALLGAYDRSLGLLHMAARDGKEG